MNKFFKILTRVASLPFVMTLLFIAYSLNYMQVIVTFTLYGGEWITYRKGDRATVKELFEELKNKGTSESTLKI